MIQYIESDKPAYHHFSSRIPVSEKSLSDARVIIAGREHSFYDLFSPEDENQRRIEGTIAIVEHYTGITLEEIRSRSKKQDIVFARMILSYHLKKWFTSVEVGKIMHKDHSSILYQVQKYYQETEVNPDFKVKAGKIKEEVRKLP